MASKRKEVALCAPPAAPGAPPKSALYVLHSQADLERALDSLDCADGWLLDEASQVHMCRFVDLRDGGSYSVVPQPVPPRQVWSAA